MGLRDILATDLAAVPFDTTAADTRKQRLRNDAENRCRELRTNLVLLIRGKRVDDSVNRALGAGRMQRTEHNVSGFGRGDGGFDGFQVAHFADENHVGILPERAANRLRETRHVDADLALVDRRHFVFVIEFDRILNRDDVMIHRFIDEVDHAGQRRTLARPGRTRDDEQTTRTLTDIRDDLRQFEIFDRHQLVRNLAQDHRDVSALFEHRDAKSRHVAESESEVGAARLLEFLLAAVGRDALHQRDGIVGIERLGLEPAHATVQPEHRRLAYRDMEIARTLLHNSMQQLVN